MTCRCGHGLISTIGVFVIELGCAAACVLHASWTADNTPNPTHHNVAHMASTTSVGGAGVGAGAGAGAEMNRSAAASGATMPVLGAGKRRRDGRKLNQLRPFVAQQGFINRADGSAKLSVGDSSVIVGVYGPMKPKAARMERPDEAVIAVSVTTSDGGAQGAWEACEACSGGMTFMQ